MEHESRRYIKKNETTTEHQPTAQLSALAAWGRTHVQHLQLPTASCTLVLHNHPQDLRGQHGSGLLKIDVPRQLRPVEAHLRLPIRYPESVLHPGHRAQLPPQVLPQVLQHCGGCLQRVHPEAAWRLALAAAQQAPQLQRPRQRFPCEGAQKGARCKGCVTQTLVLTAADAQVQQVEGGIPPEQARRGCSLEKGWIV